MNLCNEEKAMRVAEIVEELYAASQKVLKENKRVKGGKRLAEALLALEEEANDVDEA